MRLFRTPTCGPNWRQRLASNRFAFSMGLGKTGLPDSETNPIVGGNMFKRIKAMNKRDWKIFAWGAGLTAALIAAVNLFN